MLLHIADDEERHAALAWQIVRWALPREGARQALELELAHLPRDAAAPAPPAPLAPLARHGVLDRASEAHAAAEVIAGVVIPCATALLA